MSEAHRAPTRHLRESSYGTLGVYANQPVRQAHTKHGPASVVCHPSVQHLGAISTCSQSPRGLATALALAWPAAFSKEMCRGQRAAGTYRHTGHSDAELKTATWRAARDVAAERPFASWEALEDRIAEQVACQCGAASRQAFAARQAAADLTQVAGCVHGLRRGQLPKTSRLGTGAQAGFVLAAAAEGRTGAVAPRRTAYVPQTETGAFCGYHRSRGQPLKQRGLASVRSSPVSTTLGASSVAVPWFPRLRLVVAAGGY